MLSSIGVSTSRARELYEATSSVIGQERTRKQMAALLDRQWDVHEGRFPHAGAALLGGRSGTGKTMTARMMCEHLGLPYAETDATRYAEVAYKGLQLPQMFIPLMQSAARMKDGADSPTKHTDSIFKREDLEEIVERAQSGVILLDEFDKWMQRINHVTGQRDTAIQGELLKMIEGSREFITATDDEVGVAFDTSRVLIICAGAFVGLYQQVLTRLHEDADPRAQRMDENFWNSITPADFERFGLLPELAGRLSRHIFTRNLTTHHLREILTNKGGLIEEYRMRFQSFGVRWDIGDAGVIHIVHSSEAVPTGARALDHICYKMLDGEVMYEASVTDRPMSVQLEPGWPRARLVPIK